MTPTVPVSEAVRRLLAVAARLGYTVDLTSPDPIGPRFRRDRIGWTDYSRRYVWVDPQETGVHQALILLHELGHALAAERMGFGSQRARPRRELQRLRTGEMTWTGAVQLDLFGSGRAA